MQHLMSADWAIIRGAAMVWLGALITANGGLPYLVKKTPKPQTEPGSVRAFMVFWLDQYAYIGLLLWVLGSVSIIGGFVA